MNIYVAHSTSFDYENELYKPILNSKLVEGNNFVLPYKNSKELFDSKTFLKEKADILIAEVSYASTGLGIELAWAKENDVKVICFYKSEKYSRSITVITDKIIKYENEEDLILKIEKEIGEIK
jgi:hypothetical protein